MSWDSLVGKYVIHHRCDEDLTDIGEIVGQVNAELYVLRLIWAEDDGPEVHVLVALPVCWETLLVFNTQEQLETWLDLGKEDPKKHLRVVSFQKKPEPE